MSKEREQIGPIVAQGLIRGEDFNKVLIDDEKTGIEVRQPRAKMLMVGVNQNTGDTAYVRLDDSAIPASDVPTVSFTEAREWDNAAVVGPELRTHEKSRLSRSVHSTEADIRSRGGDPNYRIPKPARSFLLGIHPSEAGRKKVS